MIRGRVASAALAFLLASCGSPAANEQAPPVDAAEAPREPDAPQPAANWAAAAPGPAIIPAALRGRWGFTVADCRSGPPRPEGLLEIGAAELRFHESRARLARVAEIGPERIVAEFEYVGEGETRVLRESYHLMPGGRALVRRDASNAPRAESDLYRRCPE